MKSAEDSRPGSHRNTPPGPSVRRRPVDHDKPMLLTDGGVENVNGAVDKLVESGLLNRVLAPTEITFSNSLIESWWRVLKHQWLYLNTLDSVRTVENLVAFYIREHNSRLPHSAFQGQTPDEMYFGTGGSRSFGTEDDGIVYCFGSSGVEGGQVDFTQTHEDPKVGPISPWLCGEC